MPKEKILITVKTYPTLSTIRGEELVCTAGLTEEGKWIRLYPIPFRKLNYSNQYRKYEWVELELKKNKRDFRSESFSPTSISNPILNCGNIDTKNNWAARKEIVFRAKKYTSISKLISDSFDKKKNISLALFKPTKILDFTYKEEEKREWDPGALEALKQGNLFENNRDFKIVSKLPYKFSFTFKDDEGKKRKLMIEDWEVGALYWRMLKKTKSEKISCEAVRNKYFNDFAKTKDLHFFLGTHFVNHIKRTKNPFIIIGTFHPKIEFQRKLEFL